TLRIAATGAPPAMRRRCARTWSAGLPPSPPQPTGKWTKARPRSYCSRRKATASVDAGGRSASSSSTSPSTASAGVVSSGSVIAPPRRPAILGRLPVAYPCSGGLEVQVHVGRSDDVAHRVVERSGDVVVAPDVER